jgi:hypothetical protein
MAMSLMMDGISAYKSFHEWNPKPEIAEAASRLYQGDINNLELYGERLDSLQSFRILMRYDL